MVSKMNHRYGIYQSTESSCVLYKEDEDGKQSTFTVLNTPRKTSEINGILIFIDNEQTFQDNIFLENISSSKELLEAFDHWAEDAPVVFEMEAQSCLSKCLQKNDNEK